MTIESEQKPRTPPEATARLTSVDLAAAIDQFTDPELLSEGKVNLIALDAIVERLGERWAQRRGQIYDHVDRTLQRRLGAQGYHLRVSETDFLICQPELGRFSGQAACLQALREILTYFIGEAAQAEHCVHQVTKVSANSIEGWRVRASEVEEGEQAERQASASRQAGRPTTDRWTPFLASDGRELGVTCSLEPVIELKSFGRIGFRIVAHVQVARTAEVLTANAISRLSGADILRIDLATVARGMEQLRATAAGELQPSLIVPVSFTTLSRQRGRAEIAKLLMEARSLVERGVLCEIGDVTGVPPGVMLSVVSLVRPYCLFVVAHIDRGWSPASLGQLKRSGVQALSIECPQGFSDAAFIRWTKTTIEATRRVARSTLVYRVASPGHAILAAELGASHASVRE
jgi:hypothetical protein